ncbi:hypothetical protein Kpol_1007p14 [Vanderwaltozyma polyspora DSM 70294]|uniref:Trafficking protein particle complex subunit n=1 Tax=Vanderwaltozyma polyspora (strain ATCC 22028 / DSM 70294 / BCRC 21397 / CBS 2163 / NBRC 10782 / NRRL Y-8283 / UCD 57-17) TaxID=436907 RepID=A7TRT6_VANPO|nr:uncharacterized protein Kpol_1007p14 [Vanderwaltozyma polyspora DSM 70294]EDO15030.1 hypothetical protein Kpol_1007p14 [Vanderwaltozyma polyspora DSM 70294]
MAIQSLLVINKSGGLIYHRNFDNDSKNNSLNSNDYLILASTLHSVFAIASQLTPKAIQINQNNVNNPNNLDYKIPYIPYVGMSTGNGSDNYNSRNGGDGYSRNDSTNSTNSSNKNSKLNKLGSFKGDDYFKEPFVSWNKSGLRQLSTDQFTMFIYQTMTGLKFLAISSSVVPHSQGISDNTQVPSTIEKSSNLQVQIADNFLRKVYCIYSDYVMKDPFYSLEMPIKSELFDRKVKQMVDNLL